MRFLIASIAATLLATAASASPAPISTDDARALAGRTRPCYPREARLDPAKAPISTDDARALAGQNPRVEGSVAAVTLRAPKSSDEARLLAGLGHAPDRCQLTAAR